MIMELASWWVWPVDRACLLLIGTWSHLWYNRGYVLAHLFLWFVFPTCILRLITLWYLSHYIVNFSILYPTSRGPCLPLYLTCNSSFRSLSWNTCCNQFSTKSYGDYITAISHYIRHWLYLSTVQEMSRSEDLRTKKYIKILYMKWQK
jgi:hypothetical protein